MKKKRYFLLSMVLMFFTMIAVGCGSSASNDAQGDTETKTITLKVATYVAPTSPVYKYLTDPWMKKVSELTNDKVQFDVYPGEQLGKAHDLLQLTKDKVTDIGVFPANYFPDNMPLTNVIAGLPNLSRTSYEGTMAYHEVVSNSNDLLETDYLRNGIRPIMTHVSPAYEIWTTEKELKTPEDLKGLKIRTPGGVANQVYESLGAVPVAVSHSETYEALEKGVIDAASYSSVGVEGSGTQTLLKYAMFPHLGTAIHGLVINETVWKGLPKDIQDAMIIAGQEIMEQSGSKYDEDTEAFNNKFTTEGATIVELTAEEQETWTKKFDEFNENWLKEIQSDELPYEEVLNLYKENLKKYQ